MTHKRKLPEDGCLKPLTTSNIRASCNIMVIRVPDEMRKPGELAYQLANRDRSIARIEFTADKYVDNLIPGLPKVDAPKESRSPLNTKKIYVRENRINLFKKKVDTSVSKHQDQKLQSDRKRIETKKISPDDIDPWIKKPWENNTYFGINPVLPMNSSSSLIPNSSYYNMDIPGPVVPMNPSSSFISNSVYNNMDTPGPVYNPVVPSNPSSSLISNSAYNNMDMSGPVHNPVVSTISSSSLISNSACNNMDMPGPVCNSYGPEAMYTNNAIYENNYNENPRYEGMSGNSYINSSAGNQRNELLMSRMPNSSQSFVQPSNKGLIRNGLPPRKGLLGDCPASTVSFKDNFVKFPRENVSLNPKVEGKMFPRNDQNSFVKTTPHNINRNLIFGCRNNNCESGNFEKISTHDIFNKSFNNQKGNGKVFYNFQKNTNFTYKDRNMGASDNLCENSIDEHQTASNLTSAPFRKKRKKNRRKKSLNTIKFTTDSNIIPERFGYNHSPLNNSKVVGMNSLPSKSHLIGNQASQKQFKKQLPGQYNIKGRYENLG